MDTFKYFAYGSNMLTQRLQDRCPSATPKGIAIARGYTFEIAKLSKDKSGKATLVDAGDSITPCYGVLFEITAADIATLDRIEGRGFGYDIVKDFIVTSTHTSRSQTARTYKATTPDKRLKPYDWYKALTVAGAREHELPDFWIDMLDEIAATPDPKPDRPERLKAIQILTNAGYPFA